MDGVILVDKPPGISSAEVVRRIKSRVKPSRVGHLGTLDPIATGLLPILVGEATKLAPFIEGGDKEYEGVIRLGVETDTLDREGKFVRSAEIPQLDQTRLDEVAWQFTGKITQTPPIFSAIKRAGVPLYRLARKGGEVEPPAPRAIIVRELRIRAERPDTLRFHIICTPGTYLRALARDAAAALGTAGHLLDLRRLRSGTFLLNRAHQLDDVLVALDCDTMLKVIGLRESLADLPEVFIDGPQERKLRNGDPRVLDGKVPAGWPFYKVVSSDGRLIAMAKPTSGATAVILRIFSA
ncbi:MAG: tRNA pseudouridine(55) synthase TruB [Candidatus Binataceae bacterium]